MDSVGRGGGSRRQRAVPDQTPGAAAQNRRRRKGAARTLAPLEHQTYAPPGDASDVPHRGHRYRQPAKLLPLTKRRKVRRRVRRRRAKPTDGQAPLATPPQQAAAQNKVVVAVNRFDNRVADAHGERPASRKQARRLASAAAAQEEAVGKLSVENQAREQALEEDFGGKRASSFGDLVDYATEPPTVHLKHHKPIDLGTAPIADVLEAIEALREHANWKYRDPVATAIRLDELTELVLSLQANCGAAYAELFQQACDTDKRILTLSKSIDRLKKKAKGGSLSEVEQDDLDALLGHRRMLVRQRDRQDGAMDRLLQRTEALRPSLVHLQEDLASLDSLIEDNDALSGHDPSTPDKAPKNARRALKDWAKARDDAWADGTASFSGWSETDDESASGVSASGTSGASTQLKRRRKGKQITIGHTQYRIRKQIGAGSFGRVYLADADGHSDKSKRRHFVVKEASLAPESGRSAAQMVEAFVQECAFQREAARHCRYITKPAGWGVDTSVDPAIGMVVLEQAKGDLVHALSDKELTPTEAIGAVRDAALGLAWCHGKGIAHYDIKPGNIGVGRDGQGKLFDFGFAFKPEQDRPPAGGTPAYAPFDRDLCPGPPVDVWALGLTLFAVVAGHPLGEPYYRNRDLRGYRRAIRKLSQSPDPAKAIRKLLRKTRRGASLSSEAASEVAAVVAACLAPNGRDRPSAQAAADALSYALS